MHIVVNGTPLNDADAQNGPFIIGNVLARSVRRIDAVEEALDGEPAMLVTVHWEREEDTRVRVVWFDDDQYPFSAFLLNFAPLSVGGIPAAIIEDRLIRLAVWLGKTYLCTT